MAKDTNVKHTPNAASANPYTPAVSPTEGQHSPLVDVAAAAQQTIDRLTDELAAALQQRNDVQRHADEATADLTATRLALTLAQQQIHLLQSSTSWRLTAPLRSLTDTLRRALSARAVHVPVHDVAAPEHVEALVINKPDDVRQTMVEDTTAQWFVDISELIRLDGKTGIGRVVRSILNEWLASPPTGFRVEPVYATTASAGYRYARQFMAERTLNDPSESQDDLIAARSGDVFVGADLAHHVVIAQEPVLQSLHASGVHMWFIVYDLLPIRLPGCFHANLEALHHQWLHTVCQFDGLACISATVADDTSRWLDQADIQRHEPLAIEWFHLGANMAASSPSHGMPLSAPLTLASIRARPAFLMVGTIEPRKGYGQTLAAFEELWADNVDVNLVIVGKPGWLVDALLERLRTHPEQRRRLFWLESVSDEYLEEVYAACSCLLAASYGEGFGLPLIEAAQHRLPVLARNLPVFQEVAGDNASYFEAATPAALALAIDHWLTEFQQGSHRRSDNMKWSDWKQSTQDLTRAVLKHQPQRDP